MKLDTNISDPRSGINETCKVRSDCVGGLDCISGTCQCGGGTFEVRRMLGPLGQQSFCQPGIQYCLCYHPLQFCCQPCRRAHTLYSCKLFICCSPWISWSLYQSVSETAGLHRRPIFSSQSVPMSRGTEMGIWILQ